MNKKKQKEFLEDITGPFSEINFWISQSIGNCYVTVNNIYSDKFRFSGYNIIAKNLGKINDDEIRNSILTVLSKNFRKMFWKLYFDNKTLNLPCYKNAYYNRFKDAVWHTTQLEPELYCHSLEDFLHIMRIFCCEYEITDEKINIHDLPTIEIRLIINVEKAIENIKKTIIDYKDTYKK